MRMIIIISPIDSQLQSLLILKKRVLTANRCVGNFEPRLSASARSRPSYHGMMGCAPFSFIYVEKSQFSLL